MSHVGAIQGHRVPENGRGFAERDAVLGEVRRAFFGSHSNTRLVYTKSEIGAVLVSGLFGDDLAVLPAQIGTLSVREVLRTPCR